MLAYFASVAAAEAPQVEEGEEGEEEKPVSVSFLKILRPSLENKNKQLSELFDLKYFSDYPFVHIHTCTHEEPNLASKLNFFFTYIFHCF